LQAFFMSLGEAFRAGNAVRIGSHFDAERALDEIDSQKIVPRALFGNRQANVRSLRNSMEQALAQQAPLLAWDRSEIRHMQQNGSDLVVIARHRVKADAVAKMRWWLTKRDGAWRIYDLEDLDVAIRISVTVAGILADRPAKLKDLQHHGARLREALIALGTQNDADTAERKLQEIAAVPLPKPMDAVRWMVNGVVQLHRNQPQAALDAFAKAHDLHADMPVLDVLKGMAYNHLGQWDKALTHLQAYHDLLGDDAGTNRELGEAFRGLGRVEEARTAYRKSLDENPKDAEAFMGLLRTVGPDETLPDLGKRFAKLDSPRANFEVLYEDCRQARDGTSLDQLAQAMLEIDANYAPAHFARALAKAWAGQAEPAIAHFWAAGTAEKDDGKRRGQTMLFLQAMADTGLARQAYAASTERREAFQILTAELRKTYRMDDLRPLVAAHARIEPADPLLPWYQAEVFAQAGQYALADKAFVTGLAKPPDAATLDAFRPSRVLAKYHTGQALAAYKSIGPARQTFQQLAHLADLDRKDALLQELIDAHGKDHADDLQLNRFRIRLQLRRGAVDAAITVFQEAAKSIRAEQRGQLTFDFVDAMVEANKAMEAYRALPDPLDGFRTLAAELRTRGQHDELRWVLDAHRKVHADDIALALETAALHRAERQWDKAAAVLAEAWSRAPQEQRNQFCHAYVYALGKAGRAREAYDKAPQPDQTFRQLAYLLLHDKKAPELLALIEAHWPLVGNDPELYFIDARAKVLAKRQFEAMASWQRACKLQSNADQRRYYIVYVVREMHAAGDGMAAYRGAPDRAVAFEALARQFVIEKKAAALELLLQEHTKTLKPNANEDSPAWVLHYQGELALLSNRVDNAEQYFRRALARAKGAERHQIRQSHHRAQVRRGNVVNAYEEAGESTRNFEDLAKLCVTEKNAGQLAALIAARRKMDPDDPILAGWDVEVKMLAEDYAGALALLTKERETLSRSNQFGSKFDTLQVRSLIGLKRHDDAVREAKTLVERRRFRARILLILAHASAGQVKEAIGVADQRPRDRYLVSDCYRDPDVGPLLRAEPMRAFRDRFPEPPPDSDPDDDD
jgi:predicted Zn-dependent protease